MTDVETSSLHQPLTTSRIRELVQERLHNSPYCAVRTVSCDYHDGVLILRGRLATYFHKQIAQEVVSRLGGVLEIANRIDVVRPAARSGHPTTREPFDEPSDDNL